MLLIKKKGATYIELQFDLVLRITIELLLQAILLRIHYRKV